MNRQEVRLFAFTKTAVYEYDAKANTLVKKASGDHRDLLASGGGNPAFEEAKAAKKRIKHKTLWQK